MNRLDSLIFCQEEWLRECLSTINIICTLNDKNGLKLLNGCEKLEYGFRIDGADKKRSHLLLHDTPKLLQWITATTKFRQHKCESNFFYRKNIVSSAHWMRIFFLQYSICSPFILNKWTWWMRMYSVLRFKHSTFTYLRRHCFSRTVKISCGKITLSETKTTLKSSPLHSPSRIIQTKWVKPRILEWVTRQRSPAINWKR